MHQLTTDLRAGFANVIESAKAEEAEQAPAPAAKRGFMTEGRTKLFRDMLFERFPAERAQQRFDIAMESIAMAQRQGGYRRARVTFDRYYTWLRQQPKLAAPKTVDAAQSTPSVGGTLPLCEGRFTVEFEDGSHKTLRIRQQDEDAKFMPGRLIVGHLTGPDNSSDYTNVGHVAPNGQIVIWKKHRDNEKLAEALRVLAGDPLAAVKAYARMSQHCGFCGKPLTHPTSLDYLYGERCAEKHGLPWG